MDDGSVTGTNSKRGRIGRPPVTSRAQILAAARQVIDRDGWEKLTIRRLAAELGVGPTTLYHHVRDREDLLVQLINELADQTPRPALPEEPRERIITAATAMHDSLAAWPWAAEVLTTDGFIGRLGDSALWMVETIVAGAVDHGCTPDRAVDVFRGIWYFTVGEILVRAHSASRRVDVIRTDDVFGNLDAAEQPHLATIGGQWPAIAERDIYPQTLQVIVDGLLTQFASRTTNGDGR